MNGAGIKRNAAIAVIVVTYAPRSRIATFSGLLFLGICTFNVFEEFVY